MQPSADVSVCFNRDFLSRDWMTHISKRAKSTNERAKSASKGAKSAKPDSLATWPTCWWPRPVIGWSGVESVCTCSVSQTRGPIEMFDIKALIITHGII